MSMISVVLPVYNEEELIKSSYERLITALAPLEKQGDSYELIFVDDGCRDKSFPILKEIAKDDKRVKLVSFARNYGHQTAITAGMKYAKGDAVATIDADMQDPPELICDMVAKWREGYDVVYGVHKKRAGESFFKKITAHVFYRFLGGLTSIDIPPDSGDFRLFSRQVCDEMNNLPEHNRYIRGLMVWVGYKHTPIEFDRDERKAGVTKYTLKKMLKLASDGVLGFSYKPISMLWQTGLMFMIPADLFLFSCLFWKCGALGMITAMFFSFSGMLMIAMGILGEYIARMMDEVRGRPQYTVKETINIEK